MVDDNLSFWSDIKRYEDELNADPGSLCFIPLAKLYRKLGLLDDAISVAKNGCALHPDFVEGFLVLGGACQDGGLPEEARQALEKALRLDPENVGALKLLGRLCAVEGDRAQARQFLERALSFSPEDPEAAVLFRSLNAPASTELPDITLDEEELEELTEVIEPLDQLEPLEELVELEAFELIEELEELEELDDLHDLASLEEDLEPVPPPEPDRGRNPLTTVTLAELYVSQGFLDKALSVYRDLAASEPTNIHYHARIAELIEAQAVQEPPPASPRKTASACCDHPAVERLSLWLENIRSRRHGV